MKRVLVVSADRFLSRKIELALSGLASVEYSDVLPRDMYCDICLWDIDTSGEPLTGAVTMSRTSPCDLRVPFEFSSLKDILLSGRDERAVLVCRGRYAYIRDKQVKLTELEASLLQKLMSARGEFVSRGEILTDVWSADADPGIINVYVHYLREKLEDGEKIIISSRKHGYKIDGRYL